MSDVTVDYPLYSVAELHQITMGIAHVLVPEKNIQCDIAVTQTVGYALGRKLGEGLKNAV